MICPVPIYAGLLNASFSQIPQSGANNPIILIHLLKAITAMACCARTEEQRAALRDQGPRPLGGCEARNRQSGQFAGCGAAWSS